MIHRTVQTFPPAKLNLFLEVLGKRSDGYHELDMVMLAVNVCDRLQIESIPEPEIRLDCRWIPSNLIRQQQLRLSDPAIIGLPLPVDNLVYRAVAAFRDEFKIESGFQITLEKRIPSGAGMGGASSDAASALMAAAKLSGIDPGDHRLRAIGERLGSDIPFFWGRTTSGWENNLDKFATKNPLIGAALVRGRGEHVQPIVAVGNLHFVVVYPPQPLSTAKVFAHSRLSQGLRTSEDCQRGLAAGSANALIPGLFNRLTESARELSQWVEETVEAIRLAGLKTVTMTGSGSACFAIADSAAVARRAANRLASRGLGLCFTTMPARLPAPIRYMT